MKTYSEYKKDGHRPDGKPYFFYAEKPFPYCSCRRFKFDIPPPKGVPTWASANPTFYENCENCFGFGRLPIPWSELK